PTLIPAAYLLSLHDALPIYLPPAIGIGSELRRRGHTVRFLGHAQQREGIEAAGFRFEAYTSAIRWSSAHQEPGLKGGLRIVSVLDRKSTRLNSSHVAISYAV